LHLKGLFLGHSNFSHKYSEVLHSPFSQKTYPSGHRFFLDEEQEPILSAQLFESHLIGYIDSQGVNILQFCLEETQAPLGHKTSFFEHLGGSGQSLNCALQELS
jgi:hypothetical protein